MSVRDDVESDGMSHFASVIKTTTAGVRKALTQIQAPVFRTMCAVVDYESIVARKPYRILALAYTVP